METQTKHSKIEKEKIIDSKRREVSDAAFWLSYCGMQKTIRQGYPEQTKNLVKVAWMKKPWLTFKRLHTILFEDIGAANKELIMKFATFNTSGKSFKNLSDVLFLAEELATSPKNRDADNMKHFIDCITEHEKIRNRYEDFFSWLGEDRNSLCESFAFYEKYDYSRYEDILRFAIIAHEKLATEGHALAIPFLVKLLDDKIAEGYVPKKLDRLDSPSHRKFYLGLPYCVLDMHGYHGKVVMTIFKKELLQSNEHSAFLKKYNLDSPETIETLDDYIFAYEISCCDNEIEVSGITEPSNHTMFMEQYPQIEEIEEYVYFVSYIKEKLLPQLFVIREWYFENKIKKICNEIEVLSNYDIE